MNLSSFIALQGFLHVQPTERQVNEFMNNLPVSGVKIRFCMLTCMCQKALIYITALWN